MFLDLLGSVWLLRKTRKEKLGNYGGPSHFLVSSSLVSGELSLDSGHINCWKLFQKVSTSTSKRMKHEVKKLEGLFHIFCGFYTFVQFIHVYSVAEVEQMKERFAKLLLGEDMSGGGKGVCTALAISNAITNLSG